MTNQNQVYKTNINNRGEKKETCQVSANSDDRPSLFTNLKLVNVLFTVNPVSCVLMYHPLHLYRLWAGLKLFLPGS